MALLDDSFEAQTWSERLWSTHPTYEERIHNFEADGAWVARARAEQGHCRVCPADRSPTTLVIPRRDRQLQRWYQALAERLAERLLASGRTASVPSLDDLFYLVVVEDFLDA